MDIPTPTTNLLVFKFSTSSTIEKFVDRDLMLHGKHLVYGYGEISIRISD